MTESATSGSTNVDNWKSLLKPISNYSGVVDKWVEQILSEARKQQNQSIYERNTVMNNLVHAPTQGISVCTIVVVSVALNICVIRNIHKSELKLQTIHFLLIKNLCTADLIGAILVLPVPIITIFLERWTFNDIFCQLNSTINVMLWLQHIIMLLMIKIDRILASCLPIGRYPIISIKLMQYIALFTWLGSLTASITITLSFGALFEPAIVLCVPDVPSAFFIIVLVLYSLGITSIIIGYIFVGLLLRKKIQSENEPNLGVKFLDYSGLQKTALASFAVTVAHFILYIPTILVVGLHGWILPPIGIVICDMIVYSEFFIHPAILLLTSSRMRGEINLKRKT